MTFQYLGWNIFISCLNIRDHPWKCMYFGAKLASIAGIILKKYTWCMKIHFQFHFFAIWSIPASILSITAWKAPTSTLSPSELAMFHKIDFRCFWLFGRIQDTKEISIKIARVSRLSFRFLWLRKTHQFFELLRIRFLTRSIHSKFYRMNVVNRTKILIMRNLVLLVLPTSHLKTEYLLQNLFL